MQYIYSIRKHFTIIIMRSLGYVENEAQQICKRYSAIYTSFVSLQHVIVTQSLALWQDTKHFYMKEIITKLICNTTAR